MSGKDRPLPSPRPPTIVLWTVALVLLFASVALALPLLLSPSDPQEVEPLELPRLQEHRLGPDDDKRHRTGKDGEHKRDRGVDEPAPAPAVEAAPPPPPATTPQFEPVPASPPTQVAPADDDDDDDDGSDDDEGGDD